MEAKVKPPIRPVGERPLPSSSDCLVPSGFKAPWPKNTNLQRFGSCCTAQPEKIWPEEGEKMPPCRVIEYQSKDMDRFSIQCGVRTIPPDTVVACSGTSSGLPA